MSGKKQTPHKSSTKVGGDEIRISEYREEAERARRILEILADRCGYLEHQLNQIITNNSQHASFDVERSFQEIEELVYNLSDDRNWKHAVQRIIEINRQGRGRTVGGTKKKQEARARKA